MALSIFLILLVACLLFSLVLLWHLGWLHLPSSHSAVASRHSLVHRLLKPRCPDDCPACLLASTPSSSVRPACASVRPWCEVKSRRGAPKRVNTQHYACPNQQCPYFGITDAQIHAMVGDGKHGQAEQIQTFRCQACRTTFTRPSQHCPLPFENPFTAGRSCADGASRRAGPFRRRAGLRLPSGHHHEPFSLALGNMPRRCTSTISATSSSRISNWMNCERGSGVASTCCGSGSSSTPARSFFLCSIWALARKTRRIGSFTPCDRFWPPFCLPLFTSDGLNAYFYAARSPFWILAPDELSRATKTSVGGDGRADLWSSKENLPAAQAGVRQAGDAPGHTDSSSGHEASVRLLGATEHGFHRAGESHGPTWNSCAGASHLGYCSAVPIPAHPSGVVARLLPFCPSPCSSASGTRATTRTRGRPAGSTVPTADESSGSRQNPPAMEGT